MLYIFQAIASFIMSIICYITNPIIAFFIDEDGELKGILHYWQTWDNSCNPSDLKQILPSFLTDWYDNHYEEYVGDTSELRKMNRTRWYTRCIDNNFTITERIKRYICRVYWLTRNCAYGFAFYLFSKDVNGQDITIITKEDKLTIAVDKNTNIFNKVFMYKDDRKWFSVLKWDVYKCFFFGYKIDLNSTVKTRASVATRPALRFKPKMSS